MDLEYTKSRIKYLKNITKNRKIQVYSALGYKVCYNKKGNNKLRRHVVTNTIDLAEFEKKYFEKHPEIWSKKHHRYITTTKWFVMPMRKKESKYAWKNCPF